MLPESKHLTNSPSDATSATESASLLPDTHATVSIDMRSFENRIDIIENRAVAIFSQLATNASKKALGRLTRVQNMAAPVKPEILDPRTVFRSLFLNPVKYQEMVDLLKETLEDWSGDLKLTNLVGAHLQQAYLRFGDFSKADLQGADLQGADLQSANLSGANLVRADLQGAIFNIDFYNALCSAQTLYMTEFDPEIKEKVIKDCPDLLEEPHFLKKPERLHVK